MALAMMWIDTTNTTSAKHTAAVHSHCTADRTTTQWRTAATLRCLRHSLDGSTSCRWPNFPMNDASKKYEECCLYSTCILVLLWNNFVFLQNIHSWSLTTKHTIGSHLNNKWVWSFLDKISWSGCNSCQVQHAIHQGLILWIIETDIKLK